VVQKNVLVLGYGEMGHAMQTLLSPFYELSIWSRSVNYPPLETLIPKADTIIFALPVNAHEKLLKKIRPLLNKETLCISIAKGLNSSGLTASELFKKQLQNYALIYGPMISEELCAGKAGFAQLGASHRVHSQRVIELFQPTPLHLQTTKDIIGISWSVILKNVYALLFGMIDELDMGKNVRGFVTVIALDEVNKIANSLGGKKNSSYGLAGLGDLITTGSSEDSRHHTLGRRIAKGDFSDMRAEGTHTLLMIEKFEHFDWQQYPLLSTIKSIVAQEVSAHNGLTEFFNSKI
jgi:glycerol-3-phosphate dehydrogenase (NAD(P)+)